MSASAMVDLYHALLVYISNEGVYSRSSAGAQPDQPRIRLANIYTPAEQWLVCVYMFPV